MAKKKPNKKRAAQYFIPHDFKEEVEVLNQSSYCIWMTPLAFQKMWHFVDICSQEVGWLGSVEREGRNFIITDVFMFEQEVTGTTTSLDEAGQTKLMENFLAQENGTELYNSIRFWGHSHVNMGTTPSGQDETTMKEFEENGCAWFIRGIFNKRGRAQFDIFLYDEGVRVNDVRWAILVEMPEFDIRKELETEIQKKVTTKKYVYPSYAGGWGGGNGYDPTKRTGNGTVNHSVHPTVGQGNRSSSQQGNVWDEFYTANPSGTLDLDEDDEGTTFFNNNGVVEELKPETKKETKKDKTK